MKKAIVAFSIILVAAIISTICFAFAAGTQLITGAWDDAFGKRVEMFNRNMERIGQSAEIIDNSIDKLDEQYNNKNNNDTTTSEAVTEETTY